MFGIGIVEIVVLTVAAIAITAYCGGGPLEIAGAAAIALIGSGLVWRFMKQLK
jgi:hypothetical protein